MAEEKKKYNPTVKFAEGEMVWIRFKFDKPVKSTGTHGDFYNWGIEKYVNNEWKPYTLKPSEKLTLLLLNIPVKLKTTYHITKLRDDQLDFDYFEVGELIGGKVASGPNLFSTKDVIVEEKGETPPPEVTSDTPPPNVPPQEETEITDPLEVMEVCLVGVIEMVQGLEKKYPETDIPTISNMAVSVFINRMNGK